MGKEGGEEGEKTGQESVSVPNVALGTGGSLAGVKPLC